MLQLIDLYIIIFKLSDTYKSHFIALRLCHASDNFDCVMRQTT